MGPGGQTGCVTLSATVGVWRSLVSAPVWGTGGRQFKSGHADHLLCSRFSSACPPHSDARQTDPFFPAAMSRKPARGVVTPARPGTEQVSRTRARCRGRPDFPAVWASAPMKIPSAARPSNHSTDWRRHKTPPARMSRARRSSPCAQTRRGRDAVTPAADILTSRPCLKGWEPVQRGLACPPRLLSSSTWRNRRCGRPKRFPRSVLRVRSRRSETSLGGKHHGHQGDRREAWVAHH